MPRIPANEFITYIDSFIRRGQPGATDTIFPRFMEENAIFTFPAFPTGLIWRFGSLDINFFNGAAGATSIGDGAVAPTALRYYHAVSAEHDDPVTRIVTIRVRNTVSAQACAVISQSVVAGQPVTVPRPIVVGERFEISVLIDAIGAPNVLQLRTYALQQGLGGPLPPL